MRDTSSHSSAYHEWHQALITVAGQRFRVATKPGVFAHGRVDPSSLLLAGHVVIAPGDVVLFMNCGNALLGAVAEQAGGASRVVLTDRNVISCEAARRTVAANQLQHSEVHLGQGTSALPPDFTADVVAIRIPHEKLALLDLLRDAHGCLKPDGRCYLAGATNEGAKSAARIMDQLFGNARVVAQESGHRVVVSVKRTVSRMDTLDAVPELHRSLLDASPFHETATVLRNAPVTLFSRPGVFSWDHADEATALLAGVMQVEAGESVLDLGCGSGGLGVVAARLSGTGAVTMIDADSEAVRSATRTAQQAGLTNFRVLASDVTSAVRGEHFDVVVTNPPFHVGKATDLSVPRQFIEEAWDVLSAGGRFNLVANRTLPYERMIAERFGHLATLHDGQRFKVLSATRAR